MAKFTKIYENDEIKNILTFRGKEFIVGMGQWDNGVRKAKEFGFDVQLKEAYPDDEDLLEYLEEYEVGFDYWDEEEIEDALEELGNLE